MRYLALLAGSHDFLYRDFSHNFSPIEAANNVSQHRATTFHKRSSSIEERLSPAISGSSDSFVAFNSLDYISSRTSGGSFADDDYERSSSLKTSQKLSFDHCQVVSPLKMVVSSAISKSSDSFTPDNSLDPTSSVISDAVDNYGRSSSLKTPQQFSFVYHQLVSTQKKDKGRGLGMKVRIFPCLQTCWSLTLDWFGLLLREEFSR